MKPILLSRLKELTEEKIIKELGKKKEGYKIPINPSGYIYFDIRGKGKMKNIVLDLYGINYDISEEHENKLEEKQKFFIKRIFNEYGRKSAVSYTVGGKTYITLTCANEDVKKAITWLFKFISDEKHLESLK